MRLGVEQVAGVLPLLLHAHAHALAVFDQELRRAVVRSARPARAPQPTGSQAQRSTMRESSSSMARRRVHVVFRVDVMRDEKTIDDERINRHQWRRAHVEDFCEVCVGVRTRGRRRRGGGR